MSSRGKATIPIEEYDRLVSIREKYKKLLALCGDEVSRNMDYMKDYVEQKKEYLLAPTTIRVRDICNITGWSCADVDDVNVQMAKEKLNKILERENRGYQE